MFSLGVYYIECSLQVFTLVIVRSPLMSVFRPDESVELAKKQERSALDRSDKYQKRPRILSKETY